MMPKTAALETARKMTVLYDLFVRTSRDSEQQIYYGRRYRYWSARAAVLERREHGYRNCHFGAGDSVLPELVHRP